VVKTHPYKVPEKINKARFRSSVCQREIWNSVSETSSRPIVVRNVINCQEYEQWVKFEKIRGSSLSHRADTAARCCQRSHT